MKKTAIIVVLLLVMGAFLVGRLYERGSDRIVISDTRLLQKEGSGDRVAEEDLSSLPLGTLKISPEKQQMIGVRMQLVEKKTITHTLRLLGRIAPDENRTYRITSSSELWIRKVYPPTTGSIVKKNEPLLAFYTTNFLSAGASYMYALNTLDRARQTKTDTPEQLNIINTQIRQAVEALQNLGVSDVQIAEMARTRKLDELADVVSPAAGFILSRNATLNQWVASGTELYKIADLSRVWILADIYENEAQHFKPGVKALATLPHQKKSYQATVSEVLPIFDPDTRTLKVRLEVDNQGYALRPDMFVDVELPITLPPAITVPSDALLDSGLRKTVFVDLGNGIFEPREVQTGWRLGNLVEIVKGLRVGEKIVVSGNFLLDSESRLELATQGMYGTLSKDPICGADVSLNKAEKAGKKSVYKGKIYYFSSEECKQKFDRNPDAYVKE